MSNLNFGNISFGTTTSQFVGRPIEDIKAVAGNIQQRYNLGKEAFSKLEDAASSIQVDSDNTFIKDEALDKVVKSFQEVSNDDNFAYADETIMKTAKEFKNNVSLKASIQDKAQIDDWYRQAKEDGIDSNRLNKWTAHIRASHKAIEIDPVTGAPKNIFNSRYAMKDPKLGEKALELMKNSKGSSSTSIGKGNGMYTITETESLNEFPIIEGAMKLMMQDPNITAYVQELRMLDETSTYVKDDNGKYITPNFTEEETDKLFGTNSVAELNGQKYIKAYDGTIKAIDNNFSYEKTFRSNPNNTNDYIASIVNEYNNGPRGSELPLDMSKLTPNQKESFFKSAYDRQQYIRPIAEAANGAMGIMDYTKVKIDLKDDPIFMAQFKAKLDADNIRLKMQLEDEANHNTLQFQTEIKGRVYNNIDEYGQAASDAHTASVNAANLIQNSLRAHGQLKDGESIIYNTVGDKIVLKNSKTGVVIEPQNIDPQLMNNLKNAYTTSRKYKEIIEEYGNRTINELTYEDIKDTFIFDSYEDYRKKERENNPGKTPLTLGEYSKSNFIPKTKEEFKVKFKTLNTSQQVELLNTVNHHYKYFGGETTPQKEMNLKIQQLNLQQGINVTGQMLTKEDAKSAIGDVTKLLSVGGVILDANGSPLQDKGSETEINNLKNYLVNHPDANVGTIIINNAPHLVITGFENYGDKTTEPSNPKVYYIPTLENSNNMSIYGKYNVFKDYIQHREFNTQKQDIRQFGKGVIQMPAMKDGELVVNEEGNHYYDPSTIANIKYNYDTKLWNITAPGLDVDYPSIDILADDYIKTYNEQYGISSPSKAQTPKLKSLSISQTIRQ